MSNSRNPELDFDLKLRALALDLERLCRYASAVWVLEKEKDIAGYVAVKLIKDKQVQLAITDELAKGAGIRNYLNGLNRYSTFKFEANLRRLKDTLERIERNRQTLTHQEKSRI